MNPEENVIKMISPCLCPHCGKSIVVNVDLPHPTLDIMAPEEAPEDVKEIINQNNNDISKTNTTEELSESPVNGDSITTEPETTD